MKSNLCPKCKVTPAIAPVPHSCLSKVFVYCPECHLAGEPATTRGTAISNWNALGRIIKLNHQIVSWKELAKFEIK